MCNLGISMSVLSQLYYFYGFVDFPKEMLLKVVECVIYYVSRFYCKCKLTNLFK